MPITADLSAPTDQASKQQEQSITPQGSTVQALPEIDYSCVIEEDKTEKESNQEITVARTLISASVASSESQKPTSSPKRYQLHALFSHPYLSVAKEIRDLDFSDSSSATRDEQDLMWFPDEPSTTTAVETSVAVNTHQATTTGKPSDSTRTAPAFDLLSLPSAPTGTIPQHSSGAHVPKAATTKTAILA